MSDICGTNCTICYPTPEVLQGRVETVAKAADILDSHTDVPSNWRGLVNTETLDINDVHNCVLGQIFGSYTIDSAQNVLDVARNNDVIRAFHSDTYRTAWINLLTPVSV
jgi:uncharacterized UPF0160 family protein